MIAEPPAAEGLGAPERPLSESLPETAGEPEWRIRLQAAVERSVRQRTVRAEHRRVLSARRQAGLQERQATRLARLDAAEFDLP